MGGLQGLDLRCYFSAILGGLGHDPGRHLFHQQDTETVAASRVTDQLDRYVAGPLKGGLPLNHLVHAQRSVQNNDFVSSAAAGLDEAPSLRPEMGPHIFRPRHHAGHRQHHKQNQQRPYRQQDQLFQAHAAGVLLLGRQQKLHRRPNDNAEALAVEQVDDDGNGRRTHGCRQS